MSLLPCPSCARHVRAPSASCPFCAAELPTSFGAVSPRAWPTERLGRAATFKLGAAAVASATTLLGCGDDDGSSMALYGAPPGDSGMTTTDTGARDGGPTPGLDMGPMPALDMGPMPPVDMGMGPTDDGGMMALYGGPPDASPPPPDDGGMSVDDGGGAVPLYGAPAIDDAGPSNDDGGGGMALYGAPAVDAGPADTDDGGIAALYGAVPAD